MTYLFVLGTRPEIIKLAPVVRECTARGIKTHVVHTGQHTDPALADSFFSALGLNAPDTLLGADRSTPHTMLADVLRGLGPVLESVKPDLVVVQGDTNSTLGGALAANRAGIPVAHVEAGLRSYDRRMPEEHNRVAIDHLAEILLAPTDIQRRILAGEGLNHDGVAVVGNPVVDAMVGLLATAAKNDAAKSHGVEPKKFVFATLHRQENVDHAETLAEILNGLATAAGAHDLPVLLPLHPRTKSKLTEFGVSVPDNVRIIDPIPYDACLALQRDALLIASDSGGLQEEAAYLGVPHITLRSSTERPETLQIGANVLAGTDAASIQSAFARSIDKARMIAASGASPWNQPYGDGHAAAAILDHAAAWLKAQAARDAAGKPGAPAPAGTQVSLPSDGDHTGRTLGLEEVEMVRQAVLSGTLTSTKGTFVTQFESEFAAMHGVKSATACASGSAAVHCAVAAIKLNAGDEVITTAVTDMGALTCIPYEGGVPVFCDVDAETLNVTAETIEPHITDRTRAVIVTHLFGRMCDMAPIRALADKHGILVIEDAAQAFLAEDPTGLVGTIGDISCFSFQQGKHMTTGEGGIVVTNNPDLARQVYLFVNKAWGYGDAKPDHYFPALNFRMTELQGAVALAQLGKLCWTVKSRRQVADGLTEALADIPGVALPTPPKDGKHSWWKYALRIDANRIQGGAVALGGKMRERGVFCAPRYVVKPAFECQLFQDFNAHPVTAMPLSNNPRAKTAQPMFDRKNYPGTVDGLAQVIVLPINELYTPEHIEFVATVIREEASALAQSAPSHS